MSKLSIARLAVFGLVSFLSLIVLGLSAHVVNVTTSVSGFYFIFSALGVATGLLSILSLGPMLVIDFIRTGAFTSMIWLELAVTGLLWVLWIATAGEAVSALQLTAFDRVACGSWELDVDRTACYEFNVVTAFAFVNWGVLLGYWITLLVVSIRAAQQGQGAFNTSVRQGFGAAAEKPVTTGTTNVNPDPATYPPQQGGYEPTQMNQAQVQHGYAPTQYTPTQYGGSAASPYGGPASSPAPTGTTHQPAYGQV